MPMLGPPIRRSLWGALPWPLGSFGRRCRRGFCRPVPNRRSRAICPLRAALIGGPGLGVTHVVAMENVPASHALPPLRQEGRKTFGAPRLHLVVEMR